jgi:hypothetical protein
MITLQMGCCICKRTTEAVVGEQSAERSFPACSENKRMDFVGDAPLALTVRWRFYAAGYERSFHGAPAVVDLGEMD